MKIKRIRLLTWNMGGFAYRHKQAEAWSYLAEVLKPNIALLQEVPRSRFDLLHESGLAFAYQGAAFGTMIFCGLDFSNKVASNDKYSHQSADMYLSAVDVCVTTSPLAIISVHVYPGKRQKQALKELLGFIEQALRMKPTIVGGDFNACRHYDVVYKKNAYRWFFEEMERIGFYDCHFGLHGEEKQTYWSKKTTEPYQDDHIFVPADWKDRIISCDVLQYDPARGMSDHGPVELFIDLSKMNGSKMA